MSESPFAGTRPPRAPAELRSRVIATCREAAASAPLGLLDLLWQSRRARRVWMAGVLLLTLANWVVMRPGPGDAGITGLEPSSGGASVGAPLPPWWRPGHGHATWRELSGGVALAELAEW